MAAATGHYDWEPVANNAQARDVVERMRVPGGWLYRNLVVGDHFSGAVLAMTYVPIGSAFPSSNAGVEHH